LTTEWHKNYISFCELYLFGKSALSDPVSKTRRKRLIMTVKLYSLKYYVVITVVILHKCISNWRILVDGWWL